MLSQVTNAKTAVNFKFIPFMVKQFGIVILSIALGEIHLALSCIAVIITICYTILKIYKELKNKK